MKKIFSAVVFSIFILSANFCSAEDVWFATAVDSGGYKTEYYLMTHHIKEDYQKGTFDVGIKSVFHQYGTMTGRAYQFAYLKGDWYYSHKNSSSGYELVRSDNIFLKAFNACKPYVKLAREYPIN